MEPRPDLFGNDPGLAERLAVWAATARTDEAASARAREGFLRRAAGEDATFAGVLLDLAEQGGPVLVVTAGGRRHRGVVRAVGADFCALRTAGSRDVVLAHRGIESVRPEGGVRTTGDRVVEVAVGLPEVLAVLAEDRPRVLVVTTGTGGAGAGTGLAGALLSVGRDVLSLRLDGADHRTAYVALANLVEVSSA